MFIVLAKSCVELKRTCGALSSTTQRARRLFATTKTQEKDHVVCAAAAALDRQEDRIARASRAKGQSPSLQPRERRELVSLGSRLPERPDLGAELFAEEQWH